MGTARKFVVSVVVGAGVLVPAGVAAAANPGGTGRPSQSCQDIVAAGGTEPGHASSSPGSPFNEPGPGNPGGTGGLHYTETSQYDVACFQVSSR